ncbi:MAG: ferrous iron transport protein B [Saprospirales bacterium]|nr:ferrous iron transport protein B [Saprospirales bacterium]MBK8921713.1 ferrous iron transport protein B [Saprospirales bacterium]
MRGSGEKLVRIALVGNPNSGKSTIFNQLTGLRQKTGNFPGVTVDIKEGRLRFPGGREAMLTDLPGTYSLYPTSSDEKIVAAVLANRLDTHFPDAVIYVADATHLEKHLLLLTQLLDLDLPVLLALNMSDTAAEIGIRVNTTKLAERLGIPVVAISGRTGENISKLISETEKLISGNSDRAHKRFYPLSDVEKHVTEAVCLNLGLKNQYQGLLVAHHHGWLPFLSAQHRSTIEAIVHDKDFASLRAQVDETLDRYDRFTPIVQDAVQHPPQFPSTPTDRIDAVVTHRVFGPLLFFVVMLLVFQSIYDWSTVPMDLIESFFSNLNIWLKALLPAHWLTDLLTDGILAGLAGILVFIPQIAILFLLVTILEEIGYMARVVFMFDKTMRRFGMNGRSVVSLISGGACAVPAIMSSRTIGNWQERLITTMVTPFISCSARLPVYAVLIGLAVPAKRVFGIFSLQSLTFGSMYALGVLAALASGFVMKKILRSRELSYLAIELPVYRMPHWKNLWLTVWEKVLAFVIGAGKIILIISIVLWALARFGPGKAMELAAEKARLEAARQHLPEKAAADLHAAYQLEASYAGYLGKVIEPAIRPLGYDWKIGIALIASFAAREVFVGTMSTIYSIGSSEDDVALRQKMKSATFDDTGAPVYTLATALSLLVFYALAMQCMSTLAVVKRETNSWKWPLAQFAYMSVLAYLLAWVVYNLFQNSAHL